MELSKLEIAFLIGIVLMLVGGAFLFGFNIGFTTFANAMAKAIESAPANVTQPSFNYTTNTTQNLTWPSIMALNTG